LRRWNSTVFVETNSVCAISRFVRPCFASSETRSVAGRLLDLVERVAEQQRRDGADGGDGVGADLAQHAVAAERAPDQRDDVLARGAAEHRVLERALGEQLALRRRRRLG
jgi:hypothetical protein